MPNDYDFVAQFREQILRCSRCGFCQAVCPVFGATLRPALNARGKMLLAKEVMEGELDLNDELIETFFQCTTCAACAQQCPSGVQVPEIIKAVRRDMVQAESCHPAFAVMNQVLAEHDNIYAEDELPDFDCQRNAQAECVYFVGCVGQYREEEATEATLAVLDHLAVDYTLIDEVCCCGVLEDVGFSVYQQKAAANNERILATGCKTLITGCPYCYRTFKNKSPYQQLRDQGIEILHTSQFLGRFDFEVSSDLRVTYHDPCDLGRHCGIYEGPRKNIFRIAPNFVEMPSHHTEALCCGAGGGVRGAFAKNSLEMARRRLAQVEEVGAEVLLTECNSCLHNLSNAKLRKQKFKVYTTTQFIAELLDL